MVKGLVTDTYLTDIANAIRAKNGTSTQYKPSEMAGAIENISTKVKPDYIQFQNYKGTSLNLAWLDTSNITDMEYMFSNCDNVTELDLSNFNTSNVTNMKNMFYYCSDLESLDLSNFNTSNVTNMKNMFSECRSITYLDISSFNISKVTDTGSMFYNCGAYNVSPPAIYVKDAAMQQWVLNTTGVPSNWSTANVIIKNQ